MFDGTDDYVSLPNSQSLELRNSISIEVWTKQNGTIDGTTQRTLVGKNGGSLFTY